LFPNRIKLRIYFCFILKLKLNDFNGSRHEPGRAGFETGARTFDWSIFKAELSDWPVLAARLSRGRRGASVLEEQRLKSSFRGINGAAEILYLSSNQLTQLMGNPIRDLQLNFSIPEKF
jgi:hypothetical protein